MAPTPQTWNGPAICTPADVRSHLRGIELGPLAIEDDDPFALKLCKRATKRAVNYCQRIFAPTRYEAERYDGKGYSNQLVLRAYPVLELEKIEYFDRYRVHKVELLPHDENVRFILNRDRAEITLIQQGLEFLLRGWDRDMGMNPIGWPKGKDNIEVTYRAGFEEYPEDLVEAVAMLGAAITLMEYAAAKGKGVISFSADGVSVVFGEKGPFAARIESLSEQYKFTLDSYKRTIVGSM